MKNRDFQKAYLKIIAEQKNFNLILEKGWDVLGLFDDNKQEASKAKKQTMTNLQKAVPLPKKQQPDTVIKGLRGMIDFPGKITDGVTAAVKHVPIVGNVIGTTVQTLNPVSKNFLNLDKIPDAFVKDYENTVQPVQKFLTSDKGKDLAQQLHVDTTKPQEVKALIGRFNQERWIKSTFDDKNILKDTEKKLEKEYPIENNRIEIR